MQFFIRNCNWEKTLKETRNSSKIQLSDFEKKNSSTLKNVPQNTNEHTCDNLRYVSVLICLGWSVVWFWGVIRKNISILAKNIFTSATLLKSDSSTGFFLWILQNFREQLLLLCKTSPNRWFFCFVFFVVVFFYWPLMNWCKCMVEPY